MLKVGTLLRDIEGGDVTTDPVGNDDAEIPPGSIAIVASIDGPPDAPVTLVYPGLGLKCPGWSHLVFEDSRCWEIVETPDD